MEALLWGGFLLSIVTVYNSIRDGIEDKFDLYADLIYYRPIGLTHP